MTRVRAILFFFLALSVAQADWPQWRGPSANGIAPDKDVPTEWGPNRNIAWKVPLSGVGTSTPIIWGDRVFLTSQMGDGPSEGYDFAGASVARRMGRLPAVQLAVHAFSRASGKLLWEYKFDAERPTPSVHIKHNLASPSCATDGKLVYAWMGTGQLVALDMDGKLVWKRNLGPFEIQWGHGSSPLLYMDSLILLCDHQGKAYLLSLDKRSGKQLWKVDRGGDRRAYSTPFIIPGKNGDELVINSSERIDVVDPATGAPLWHLGDFNRVPVSTPVFHNGILYTSRGYSSGPYMAVKTGGKKGEVKWQVPTGAPYVSSLLYYVGLIYMVNEMGIASCVDAETGKLLWRERLGGVFSASPVAAAGKVYLINEDGEAFVLAAGRDLKILHRNKLGERTLASPAISEGQIFLRTDQHLICVGQKRTS